MMKSHPRSAYGASPSRGRRWRTGKAGSAAAWIGAAAASCDESAAKHHGKVSTQWTAPRPLVLALALAFLGPVAAQAQTLPTGFSLVSGNVTELTAGNLMTLTQTSPRAIVNWDDFAVGPTEIVNILQPGVDSVMLNRVLPGAKPSFIEGTLTATGRIFLLNPEGVMFTSGSQVSVGGLVASTLGMSDSDFNAGNYVFSGVAIPNARVGNEGSISTTVPGGTIAFISPEISHVTDTSGLGVASIQAPGGTVGLIGAERVRVDFHGDGLTSFIVDTATVPVQASVTTNGLVQADGGRIAVLVHGSNPAGQVINLRGTVRAQTLAERRGEIVLEAVGPLAAVNLDADVDVSAPLAGTDGGRVSVTAERIWMQGKRVTAQGDRDGGEIQFRGNDVTLEHYAPGAAPTLDASGGQRAGLIDVRAGNILAMSQSVAMHADGLNPVAQGGTIRALGGVTLYAHGELTARGGASGGDGGLVETSSAALSANGLRVNASAPGGRPGTWLIDPYNITIQHGSAVGPPGPWTSPLANTVLQDGDINAALNSGTNVTIATGDPAAGNSWDGDITLENGVHIRYDQPMGELALRLQAHRSVRSDSNVLIESDGGGGPLNVIFEADVNGAGAASGGGQVSFSGDLYTNGGRVEMSGAWANASLSGCSICLDGAEMDTRVGRSDAGAGGDVWLTGYSQLEDVGSAGVYIDDMQIRTSTGTVHIDGRASQGSGVWVAGSAAIHTTSGAIDIQGIGGASTSSLDAGHGVFLTGITELTTTSGAIRLRGRAEAGGALQGSGVRVADSAQVTSASGLLDVTGQAVGAGAGLRVESDARIDGGVGVVLRAGNDGSVDAIELEGAVRAGQWLNLRPGQVSAAGAAADDTATVIRIGGAGTPGFSVSGAELARLDAPELILGSDQHAADIVVAGPVARGGNLSLQNSGSADIDVQGPLSANRLTLAAGRDVRQAAGGGGLQAQTLVVRAGGNALLEDGAANTVERLAAMAAGTLSFFNSGPLTVVHEDGVGVAAAAPALQLLPTNGVRAGQLRVVAGTGDLTLQAPVHADGQADLVAARNFRNDAAAAVTAGGVWRIWSDTWVGEARGGLAGSGSYPNLYGRDYASSCGVPLPNEGNTFLYAQRPEVVATLADAWREYGRPDPAFSYSLAGLILGDSGRGIGGLLYSTAGPASPAGSYAIRGNLDSVEGYRVRVVPGVLQVLDHRLPAPPDVVREMPQTFTYDRNIALAPMCFATGPLTDPQAGEKEGDVLAREWARVRSRPQLSNCVATEDRNGCASF